MYVIAGLGNPTRKYEITRHNAGFLVMDRLAERHGISVSKREFDSLTGYGVICGKKALIVKPQTYMNLSGNALGPLARYYGVSEEELILVHDDVEFPLGVIKTRKKGSAGTHNGMKSVIEGLGTQDFTRLRFGVGNNKQMELYSYVLSNFEVSDSGLLNETVEKACDIIETILTDGVDIAMNKFNPKREKTEKKHEEEPETEKEGNDSN